jgi:colanic acid/amylovoran biosynthesis glycosyltransferase
MTAQSDRRTRIGYLVSIFPGPTETFVAREIEALKNRGFDVTVFAIKRPDVMPSQSLSGPDTLASCEYARPDGIVRHLLLNIGAMLRHPLRYFSTLRAFLREGMRIAPPDFARLLYHFVWGVALSSTARKRGIDHFHGHFASASSAALAANLYSGISFSFTGHASADLFVNPVMIAMKVRQAVVVVTESEYARRYLDSITDFAHSNKFHRVYNGIDADEPGRFLPSEGTRIRTSPGVFHLLSVGRLVGFKGHGTLVDVCRVLRQEGLPIRCTIVGSGPQRAVLERRIQEAGLMGVVELAGALPIGDVYAAMEAADVFVLLTEINVNGYRDGFPTVILEAMTMGLPVVSTWVSGIPEAVEDQVTGILVPERDTLAASTAIRRLLGDPALRKRMGLAGRERVSRLFPLAQSADQLSRLLHDTLAERSRSDRSSRPPSSRLASPR